MGGQSLQPARRTLQAVEQLEVLDHGLFGVDREPEKLPAAGISTPAVVALSQLIAFVSYQLRVVAGLKAMRAAAAH